MDQEAVEQVANDVCRSLERLAAAIHDPDRIDPGPVALTDAIEHGLNRVAHAITAPGAPDQDAAGGSVGSLTEAVMGVTAGLFKIAEALESVAESIRESR